MSGVVVEDQREQRTAGDDGEQRAVRLGLWCLLRLEFPIHHEQYVSGGSDEQQLHNTVVH